MLGSTGHVVELLLKLVYVSLGSREGLSIHKRIVVMMDVVVGVGAVDVNTRVVSTRTESKVKNVPEAATIAALARQIAARIRYKGAAAIFAFTACLS